jgi:hypothetical protein
MSESDYPVAHAVSVINEDTPVYVMNADTPIYFIQVRQNNSNSKCCALITSVFCVVTLFYLIYIAVLYW